MPFQDQNFNLKIEGKWHFGATFIDNEGCRFTSPAKFFIRAVVG
jgi:hypothetical protein